MLARIFLFVIPHKIGRNYFRKEEICLDSHFELFKRANRPNLCIRIGQGDWRLRSRLFTEFDCREDAIA